MKMLFRILPIMAALATSAGCRMDRMTIREPVTDRFKYIFLLTLWTLLWCFITFVNVSANFTYVFHILFTSMKICHNL